MEECDQKISNVFDQFGITMPCSATYFLKVGARVSLKANMEECNQKVRNVFDQFGITIPGSATYFLEVDAHVSMKVANKGCLSGKNTLKI